MKCDERLRSKSFKSRAWALKTDLFMILLSLEKICSFMIVGWVKSWSIIANVSDDGRQIDSHGLVLEGSARRAVCWEGERGEKGDYLGPNLPNNLKKMVRTRIVHTSGTVFEFVRNKCSKCI